MSINFALAKGRVAKKSIVLLEELGFHFPDYHKDSRKLIFTDETGKLKIFLVKSPDVPTYVEKGAADIGIVGKDVLLEHPADVYELVNLNIGKCKMCTAGFEGTIIDPSKKLIVGSKYPRITKDYFENKHILTDVIMINGSVELAPIIGLSDIIVDIVESGNTLRDNGLVVLEEICDISSRLIANKVSLKTKNSELQPIIEAFEKNSQ
jgi:ATP phosphoribosyltransferase